MKISLEKLMISILICIFIFYLCKKMFMVEGMKDQDDICKQLEPVSCNNIDPGEGKGKGNCVDPHAREGLDSGRYVCVNENASGEPLTNEDSCKDFRPDFEFCEGPTFVDIKGDKSFCDNLDPLTCGNTDPDGGNCVDPSNEGYGKHHCMIGVENEYECSKRKGAKWCPGVLSKPSCNKMNLQSCTNLDGNCMDTSHTTIGDTYDCVSREKLCDIGETCTADSAKRKCDNKNGWKWCAGEPYIPLDEYTADEDICNNLDLNFCNNADPDPKKGNCVDVPQVHFKPESVKYHCNNSPDSSDSIAACILKDSKSFKWCPGSALPKPPSGVDYPDTPDGVPSCKGTIGGNKPFGDLHAIEWIGKNIFGGEIPGCREEQCINKETKQPICNYNAIWTDGEACYDSCASANSIPPENWTKMCALTPECKPPAPPPST